MIRKWIFLIFFCLLYNMAGASNVRIERDVWIDPYAIQNGIATIDFKIAWDNSWRDDENWDAVYVFLKYKKGNENIWSHVLLMDAAHEFTDGYGYWTRKAPNGAVNRTQGVFIYREQNGGGQAEVDVKLRWMLSQNGLSQADFQNVGSGGVECRLMCIEMVYVPKGPFALGDKSSTNALGNTYNTILPEWDLIKNDGSMTFFASGDINSDHYIRYSPENAANRVNEIRSKIVDNAWYATTAGASEWGVDFGTKKTVRYFGINGVLGYPAYVPALWGFYGSDSKTGPWTTLGTYNASNWSIDVNSYPITNAIKISSPQAFRYYKIGVTTSTYGPMISNISMTEVDLATRSEHGYIVDKTNGITLDLAKQLGSADGDTWSGALNGNYPSGYEGFYAMKYEVSQKQYVGFLNKLLLNQQKNRTVGIELDQLNIGDYVYTTGSLNHKSPAARNGIVVAGKTDDRYVFACNLNAAGSDDFEKQADGLDVACNFLSPADMLAYADWTGLRPMSELEYEKMGRALFPVGAKQKEWAAGVSSTLVIPSGDTYANVGKETEKLSSGNANIGNRTKGPTRCGSFASGAASRTAAGASYWGLQELSGNLAEIYYNINSAGRPFQSVLIAHGDGILYNDAHAEAGGTDFGVGVWPRAGGAFTLRGGSFKSMDTREAALSDRSKGQTTYSDWNQKREEATFRLGHSYTYLGSEPCTTYLKLANGGVSTANDAAKDTVCSGSSYKIIGSPLLNSTSTVGGVTTDVNKEFVGKISYMWYYSRGGGWILMPEATGKDLDIPAYTGRGTNYLGSDSYLEVGESYVYFKRVTTTPTLWSETFQVRLRVVTDSYKINSTTDVINKLDQIKGLLVETKYPTDFTWTWKSGSGDKILKNDRKSVLVDYLSVERDSFENKVGVHTVVCDMKIGNKCLKKQEYKITIEAKPTTGIPSGSITLANCGEVMKDIRDNQLYGTSKIGNQCWMAQNLNFFDAASTKYRTKDPQGKDGAIYKYITARRDSLCPEGFRLPTNAEVNEMNAFLNQDGLGRAGAKLKAGNYWNVIAGGRLNMGTNDYGFGAKGVGYNVASSEETTATYFITSDNKYVYFNNTSTTILGPGGTASSYWMPIRCIKK